MSNKTKKSNARAAEQLARRQVWETKLTKMQVGLGYVIVGISAVFGFLVHPAIGVGLTVLAGGRLFILRRQMQREAKEEDSAPPENPRPGHRSNRSIGRARA